MNEGRWRIWSFFKEWLHPRTPGPGEGKHYRGKRKPKDYRLRLKAARKRERRSRRYVRLQKAGRKHRMKGV